VKATLNLNFKDQKFLSPQEIAEELEISKMTALKLIKNGEIQGLKIGRQYKVPVDSFKNFIEKSST